MEEAKPEEQAPKKRFSFKDINYESIDRERARYYGELLAREGMNSRNHPAKIAGIQQLRDQAIDRLTKPDEAPETDEA